MKKLYYLSVIILILLPLTSNAQGINNGVVRNAEIVQLDGKYKGTDASVIIDLSPKIGGGTSISVDFEGQTIRNLIVCMWLDSENKVLPLYSGDAICIFESEDFVETYVGFSINYMNGKILFSFEAGDESGEIDVSHVFFKPTKNSTKVYSDNDLKKSYNYLKVFFKRAE